MSTPTLRLVDRPLPPTLRVTLIDNPTGIHPTNDSGHLYFWTPILGPTATLALPTLYIVGDTSVAPHVTPIVETSDVAFMLGMWRAIGRLNAVLERLRMFNAIDYEDAKPDQDELHLIVKRSLDRVPNRQLVRWPDWFRRIYFDNFGANA